jgi:hypothetical protein
MTGLRRRLRSRLRDPVTRTARVRGGSSPRGARGTARPPDWGAVTVEPGARREKGREQRRKMGSRRCLPPGPTPEPPTARRRGGVVSAACLGRDAAAGILGGGGRGPGSRGRTQPARTSSAAAGCSSTVPDDLSMIRKHGACPSPPAGHAGDTVRSRGLRYGRSPVQGHPQVLGSSEGKLKKSLSRPRDRPRTAVPVVERDRLRARPTTVSGRPS